MPPRRKSKSAVAAAAAQEEASKVAKKAAKDAPFKAEAGPHSYTDKKFPYKKSHNPSGGGFKSKFARKKHTRTLRGVVRQVMAKRWPPTAAIFTTIDAPVLLTPLAKYCDITGLRAKYTDPRTQLHYYSTHEYKQIQTMTRAQIIDLLELRGHKTQHVDVL